jgi:hypothetical protein
MNTLGVSGDNKIYILPRLFPSIEKTKQVVEHELGHFYVDNLIKKLGKTEINYIGFKKISKEIIGEGIAEYFARVMNDKKNFPNETVDSNNFYSESFYLVKPIIDKYGEKGIEYLLFNLPTIKELNLPREYQERILKKLSEKENN